MKYDAWDALVVVILLVATPLIVLDLGYEAVRKRIVPHKPWKS